MSNIDPAYVSGPNPADTFAKGIGTFNALNQNALFQQTFAARKAVGGIMQQSIDPQTGAPDFNKAAIMLSTNPVTAFIAPDMIKSWVDRQLVQQEVIAKTLANAKEKSSAIGDAAGALVSAGQGSSKVPRGDVIGALARLYGEGRITQEDKDHVLMNLPQNEREVYKQMLQFSQRAQGAAATLGKTFDAVITPKGGITEQGQRNVYANTYQPSAGGQIAHVPTPAEIAGQPRDINAGGKTVQTIVSPFSDRTRVVGEVVHTPTPAEVAGKPETINAGGSTIQTIVSPFAPKSRVVGEFTHTPTTEEINKPIEGTTVTGQPYRGARRDVLPTYTGANVPYTMPSAPAGWTSNSAPISGSPQGDSSVKVNGVGGAPAGTIATGLSPVQAEGLKYITNKYAPNLIERTQTANQLKLLMSQADEETKHFKTGGGTSTFLKMAQLGQALGLKSEALDKLAGGDYPSAQAGNKLFLQVGSNIAAQLIHAGGGRMTQTEWAKILSEGSANIDLDPKAIAKIFAATREAIHYTNMENEGFNRARSRYDAGNYDLSKYPVEFQESLGRHLDARKRAP